MNEQMKSLLTLYTNLQLILTNLQNRYNKLGSQVIHLYINIIVIKFTLNAIFWCFRFSAPYLYIIFSSFKVCKYYMS